MVTVFIRVLRYAKPYWGRLLGIFLLSILSASLALLQPLPLRIVVDYVIGSEPLPVFISSLVPPSAQNSGALLIAAAAALLVGLTLLNQTMMLGLRLMQTHTGESMLLDFRALLFICAQRLSLRYHDSKGASETAYRIQYDAPSIPAIIIHGVIPLVTATATLFGMIYVTAQIDMQLAIVALCISPALFLLVRAYEDPLKERWTSVKRLESSANAVLHEVLSSMRVVKAFGREEYEGERFRTRSHRSKEELQKTFFVQGRFDILIGFTIAIGMAATLYIGAWHVQEGTLSLGSLILVLAYVTAFMETFTIANFPYYEFKDRDYAYTIGSAFYAIYFIVSFPMFLRIDEHPGSSRCACAASQSKNITDASAANGLFPASQSTRSRRPCSSPFYWTPGGW